MQHCALNTCQHSLAFLKSSMQSLAFSPNCHLHCVFASYNSPGSFSGYLYSFTGFGRSARQVAWAVLEHRGAAGEARSYQRCTRNQAFCFPSWKSTTCLVQRRRDTFFFFPWCWNKTFILIVFNIGATRSSSMSPFPRRPFAIHGVSHLAWGRWEEMVQPDARGKKLL